jgi:hypothetical protein
MVGMTAYFVVAGIAVIGAVMARVTWRRPADERHSIQSHQQTLETLRSMADRRPSTREMAGSGTHSGTGAAPRSPKIRPGPARGGPVPSAAARSTALRAPIASPSNGNGRDELVFGDNAAPRADDGFRASALTLPRGLPRTGRGHRRSRATRGRASSRIVPVATAVVVLGILVGVAVAFAPSHHRGASPPSTPRHKTATRATHTSTSVPAPLEVRPTSATSSTAAYGAPSTSYTVALRATGLCWVEATQMSTGNVVWTGTLSAGQTQAIPASGSVVVRLGAANDVEVTLNGEQVILPAGFRSPFDMNFQST